MRVLVTGGCGLIGSSVVERALRDDARVTVLDNLSSGSRDHLPHDPRVELVVGDVCDESLVGALVPRCDAVFHLAAGVGVGLILARPTGSLRASLLGSEIVLRHAAAARRPVFFASTSEVYGDSDGEPLREERNVGFGSPDTLRFSYAAGKAAGEALAFAYAAEYGLPVVVGRFFNVTGPRQSGEHGAVVPAFVDQALAGGPIEIHGDGKQTRCFLDAADAAEYVWRLLGNAREGGSGLYNIGRDKSVSVLDLARRVRELVDPAVVLAHVEPAYGSGFRAIQRRRPDTRRLRAATGYAPRIELDETVRASVTARRARSRR
jgi:UDP-glucose 4-epimerase